MIVRISHQKATAIAKKFFNGEMPKNGDGFLLPSGAKLRKAEAGWMIICYSYDPARIELAPLGIVA